VSWRWKRPHEGTVKRIICFEKRRKSKTFCCFDLNGFLCSNKWSKISSRAERGFP
jgi:hypothetical protein